MSPLLSFPLSRNRRRRTLDEALKTQTLSPQEYRAIADQNLFHPDRIIPPEKKPESVLPKPEFVLYGTLITPDLKMAYLEDKKAPVTTPGRGTRQSALKIGESLSGFRVTEIQADKVILTRGEETIQVLLQEPGSSKARETTPGPGPRTPGPSGSGSAARSKSCISPAGNDCTAGSRRVQDLFLPAGCGDCPRRAGRQRNPPSHPDKEQFLPEGCRDFPPQGLPRHHLNLLVVKGFQIFVI